jgi:hypothetical protein
MGDILQYLFCHNRFTMVLTSVDACAAVTIDEAAARLEKEIALAWKDDRPCILAGDEAQ